MSNISNLINNLQKYTQDFQTTDDEINTFYRDEGIRVSELFASLSNGVRYYVDEDYVRGNLSGTFLSDDIWVLDNSDYTPEYGFYWSATGYYPYPSDQQRIFAEEGITVYGEIVVDTSSESYWDTSNKNSIFDILDYNENVIHQIDTSLRIDVDGGLRKKLTFSFTPEYTGLYFLNFFSYWREMAIKVTNGRLQYKSFYDPALDLPDLEHMFAYSNMRLYRSDDSTHNYRNYFYCYLPENGKIIKIGIQPNESILVTVNVYNPNGDLYKSVDQTKSIEKIEINDIPAALSGGSWRIEIVQHAGEVRLPAEVFFNIGGDLSPYYADRPQDLYTNWIYTNNIDLYQNAIGGPSSPFYLDLQVPLSGSNDIVQFVVENDDEEIVAKNSAFIEDSKARLFIRDVLPQGDYHLYIKTTNRGAYQLGPIDLFIFEQPNNLVNGKFLDTQGWVNASANRPYLPLKCLFMNDGDSSYTVPTKLPIVTTAGFNNVSLQWGFFGDALTGQVYVTSGSEYEWTEATQLQFIAFTNDAVASYSIQDEPTNRTYSYSMKKLVSQIKTIKNTDNNRYTIQNYNNYSAITSYARLADLVSIDYYPLGGTATKTLTGVALQVKAMNTLLPSDQKIGFISQCAWQADHTDPLATPITAAEQRLVCYLPFAAGRLDWFGLWGYEDARRDPLNPYGLRINSFRADLPWATWTGGVWGSGYHGNSVAWAEITTVLGEMKTNQYILTEPPFEEGYGRDSSLKEHIFWAKRRYDGKNYILATNAYDGNNTINVNVSERVYSNGTDILNANVYNINSNIMQIQLGSYEMAFIEY